VFRNFADHEGTEKFLLIMGHGNEDHVPGKFWLHYYSKEA